MIDSHCHLDHEPLLSDLTNVIKRSKDIGIKKLLTISTSFRNLRPSSQTNLIRLILVLLATQESVPDPTHLA